jgi:hypothetical protein
MLKWCVSEVEFAAPWSPITMTYAMRIPCFPDESVPALFGEHSVIGVRVAEGATQMSYVMSNMSSLAPL